MVFCSGDEGLKDKDHDSRPLEVDNDKSKTLIKADPLKTTREVSEELNINHTSFKKRER